MKTLYTDREQSKMLIELGLDVNTADMWYWEFPTAPSYNNYGYPMFHKGEGIRNVPCWSLSALLNIITKRYDMFLFQYHKDKWYARVNFYNSNGIADEVESIASENAIEACIDLIIKLKDENLL